MERQNTKPRSDDRDSDKIEPGETFTTIDDPRNVLDQTMTVGQLLHSRYRLEAELGRGGNGVVFRARDTELERDVAIKFLRSELDDQHRRRLISEAQAAAALNHPNTLTVHDVGEFDGHPFVVMEYVAGGSLRQKSVQDFQSIINLGQQICGALSHLHANGLIHRDIKPENILVAEDSTELAKIGDLGLAVKQVTSELITSGTIAGTPAYLAPELALTRPFDHRVDLYSLGVVLYELVTGRRPFTGGDPLSIVSQHVHAPVVPPRSYRSDIPFDLERVILRLLAKNPNDRFSTAEEVAHALSECNIAQSPGVGGRANKTTLLQTLERGYMVGRSREFGELKQLWKLAEQGGGHMALIAGEPGSGKTRLARELAVYAELNGATLLYGGCYEFEATTPYLPFVESLTRWARETDQHYLDEVVGKSGSILGALVNEIRERLEPRSITAKLSPHEERMRLFDAISRLLQSLTNRRPILLFLDDLQWADQGSLALLSYLLRNMSQSRCLIVGTYRDIEVDQSHPLAASVDDWNRGRLVSRFRLPRLTAGSTRKMICRLLGQESISDRLANVIFEETDGNPFFVEELVKFLIDEGNIFREHDEWQLCSETQLTIPPSIKTAIGRRVGQLSPSCSDMLRLASVLGKQFGYSELDAVSSMDEETLLNSIDEAIRAQVLVSTVAEEFAFTHDKIREVVYTEINPIRRIRLHQQIAETLEDAYKNGENVAIDDLAHHFFEANDCPRGTHYARQAAAAAEKVYAHDEALMLLRRALQCAETMGDQQQLAGIHKSLGLVHSAIGSAGAAAEHFQQALEVESEFDQRLELMCLAGEAYVRLGDPQGEELLLQMLEDLNVEDYPLQYARAKMVIGRFYHYRGLHYKSAELLTEAKNVAESQGEPVILGDIYIYLSAAYQHLSKYRESNNWAQRCIEFGQSKGHPPSVAVGYEFFAENAATQGRWQDAIQSAEKDHRIGDEIHSLDRTSWAAYSRAVAQHGLGKLHDTEKLLLNNINNAQQIDEHRLRILLESILAIVYTDLGEEAKANETAGHALNLADELGLVWGRLEARRSLAYLHLARGDHREVNEICQECRQLLEGSDNRQHQLLFAPIFIQSLIGQQEYDQAIAENQCFTELARQADADFGIAIAKLFDARLADVASEDPNHVEQMYGNAIQLIDDTESRIHLGRALVSRANWLASIGEKERAKKDIGRASSIFVSTGAQLDIRRLSAVNGR